MRIFILLFILTITIGCATQNIKYDRNKILKKYSAEYEMYLDNVKMDLEYVFLNKDNIKNIKIDKRAKELKITQHKPTELFEMKNLNLDSLSAGRRSCWINKKISLIVIDGIPLIEGLKEKTKIDTNAIEHLEIITKEKLNKNSIWCKEINGDVLLIRTK